MHDGCSGSFGSGKEVVNKLRMMGFSRQPMPVPIPLTCSQCGTEFRMETYEDRCPQCTMVYGVTPCHAFDANSVMPAGIDY